MSSPRDRFAAIVALPEASIDLAEAALLIAMDAYPALDPAAYLARLDDLAATLRRRLRPDIGPTESVLQLNRYLFEECGFAGNADDYYDPRNSYLNEVLDRRRGIPITLAIVYLEVARRMGLDARGVSFPGHFLVKCRIRDGTVVLDPFHRGTSLSIEDLKQRFASMNGGRAPPDSLLPELLATAGKKEILVRMLRNLKAIHLEAGRHAQALECVERILAAVPGLPVEIRDRGIIYERLECFRPALADLERYLELAPDADDAIEIRQRLVGLRQATFRLN